MKYAARLGPLAVALAIVAADRITKVAAQNSINTYPGISATAWLRSLKTVHSSPACSSIASNPGAAFGVLAEGNPILRSVVLIGVSAVVLIFVGQALWNSKPAFTSPWMRAGLSLILGGAAGNLYDRVVRGTVTDFIEVYHGSWSFPAFNVADSAITVGAVLLLFDLMFMKRDTTEIAKHVP